MKAQEILIKIKDAKHYLSILEIQLMSEKYNDIETSITEELILKVLTKILS